MSLLSNNKKDGNKKNNNPKNAGNGSKFIKSSAKPAAGATKKVRSTGANRGS